MRLRIILTYSSLAIGIFFILIAIDRMVIFLFLFFFLLFLFLLFFFLFAFLSGFIGNCFQYCDLPIDDFVFTTVLHDALQFDITPYGVFDVCRCDGLDRAFRGLTPIPLLVATLAATRFGDSPIFQFGGMAGEVEYFGGEIFQHGRDVDWRTATDALREVTVLQTTRNEADRKIETGTMSATIETRRWMVTHRRVGIDELTRCCSTGRRGMAGMLSRRQASTHGAVNQHHNYENAFIYSTQPTECYSLKLSPSLLFPISNSWSCFWGQFKIPRASTSRMAGDQRHRYGGIIHVRTCSNVYVC